MTADYLMTIRSMTADDLIQALTLSTSEGWNQTMNDWRFLSENPDNVCIVAEQRNTIIGTATALNYSNKVAWIGMVLVDKQFRGLGVGKLLMTSTIDMLRTFESVKLDATPAGYPLYQKLGFLDELILYRMTNPSFSADPRFEPGSKVEAIIDKNLSQLLEMDSKTSGLDRSMLLRYLQGNYPGKAFMAMKGDRIEGYIFGRDGLRFNYLGPVVAKSDHEAIRLIMTTLDKLKGQAVALDIFQDKTEVIKWMESVGFTIQRQFTRMYLRSNPCDGLAANQYLIAGPEFG